MARRYHKSLLIYAAVVFIMVYTPIYAFGDAIFGVFTQKELLHKIGRKMFVWAFLCFCLDYWQLIFGGPIRALGKQGVATMINIFAFFGIILPISYPVAILYDKHMGPNKEGTIIEKDGLGQFGIWICFCFGLCCLICMQNCVIEICTDWGKICRETKERIEAEAQLKKVDDEEGKKEGMLTEEQSN